jgi:hypothetical protein
MARGNRLLTREEELQAIRLARRPERARELDRLVARVQKRVVDFAVQAPAVKQRLGAGRHRVLGADLRVEEPGQRERRLRRAEVAIYDYEQDVLISVVVALQEARVVRIEERAGLQPPPSLAEAAEAEELARRDRSVARLTRGKRTKTAIFPAREASLELSPGYAHRVFEVTFWSASPRPERVAGPVFVDLSRRELLDPLDFAEPRGRRARAGR